MSALKISRSKSSKSTAPLHPPPPMPIKFKQEPAYLKYAWRTLLLASLLGLGFYLFPKINHYKKPKIQTFLSEIKVIDENGHPLTNSIVYLNNKKLGRTDSFGDLRQYLQVRTGSKLILTAKKKIAGRTFKVQKQIVFPLAQTEKAQRFIIPINTKTKKNFNENYHNIWFAMKNLNAPGLLKNLQSQSQNSGLKIKNDSSWQISLRHIPIPGQQGLIEVKIDDKIGKLQNSFLQNYTGQAELTAKKILNKIKLHAPKHYLSKAGRLQAKIPFWETNYSYLKNLHGQLYSSEKKLLAPQSCLKSCLLTKNYLPDSAPNHFWELRRLKFSAPPRQGLKFYVGGIAATQTHHDTWHYWQVRKNRSYLSILDKDKISYRKLLQSDTVNLPQKLLL